MIYDTSDTIAAVATPAGYGGIAIIRVSGPKAHEAVNRIFLRPGKKTFTEQDNNTIHYGHIVDANSEELDEVLVSKMCAPHTYTAEDVAEINCHGGYAAAKSVLDLLLKNGVRMAEPGEFTKRAFLNGRLDLSQAEAVGDMIMAKTETFSRIAVRQISGALSDTINAIKQDILELLASLEVTIQYPEYDVPEVTDAELGEKLDIIIRDITQLAASYEKGSVLRDGLKTAIAGKPNVGKSMLLNRLIGEDKAIVTDIAGTTRDVVDEVINMGGVPVRLMDTAGIRHSEDTVEAIGIQRSLDAIENAEFILFVLDGSTVPDENDRRILAALEGKQYITVINKSDLRVSEQTLAFTEGMDTVTVSAMNNEGIDEIEKRLRQLVTDGSADLAAGKLIVNARHKALIDSALSSALSAKALLEEGLPSDMVEIDIKDTWETLGRITGETADEEIVTEIFKNFCLGK